MNKNEIIIAQEISREWEGDRFCSWSKIPPEIEFILCSWCNSGITNPTLSKYFVRPCCKSCYKRGKEERQRIYDEKECEERL